MRRITALAVAALLVGGCGGDEPANDGVLVVATTTIMGDIARAVVGDAGTVETLMPISADPHAFQASSRQAAQLARADLIVANGLGLEEGLQDALASVASDGSDIVEIAPLVDPLPFEFGLGLDSADHTDDHLDPHVWMDPTRVARAAEHVAARLDEVSPGGPWSANAAAYAEALSAADARITELLSAVPGDRRVLVTSHGAFGYWAEHYRFRDVGTVIPGGSTLADPSSAELARLVDTMRSEGVTAIFADVAEPSTLADAVAAELGAGVRVVDLYTGSLGEASSGADTLIGMLITNAESVAAALT